MRPFTVLIGIVLGSAASISFGLGTVLIVFCVLTGEHPELSQRVSATALSLVDIRPFDRGRRLEFPRAD